MKNKRIQRIITTICLVVLLLGSLPLNTFAAFITEINSNARFGVISNSLSEFGHELHYAKYDGNDYMMFCSQYGKTSPNGSEYIYNGNFIVQYRDNLPEYEKIAEIIYFGYTMEYGTGLPTSVDAKRAACCTQQYVWEYIYNNIDKSFRYPNRDNWNSNYMSSSHYANYLNKVEGYYNQYHGNVSFNGTVSKVPLGETTIITDTNGRLATYGTFTKKLNGVTYSHTQGSNDLVISVSENCTDNTIRFNSKDYGIYQLMPNGSEYISSTMSNYIHIKFTSGTVQNLMFSNYVDPSAFNISIEVQSGNVLLKKTNNIGNALSDCVFELYKDEGCTQLVETATTDNNGQIIFNRLKPMTYYIREKSVATGYLIDNSIQKVEVIAGQTAIVNFKNNEPTGEIKIYKVNTLGDKVGGAEFTVKANEDIYNVAKTKKFYSKGDIVAKIISDEHTGIATITNLPLGKYIVYESQAPKGYLLNETIFNANLEYKDSNTPIIELRIDGVVNKEPTGIIQIVKKDNQTGSVPQGDATFENAEYRIYADEDIYNVAKTKKFYSKGDLVAIRTMNNKGETTPVENLPLGKYIVKEEKAPTGYMLDKNNYKVTLEYKDQYEKVITNKTTSNELVKKMGVHIFKSGIKINSGETPGLEGAEFTIKLNKLVEKAYSLGYTYTEVWNGIDENGNKVAVDSKRVAKAQEIAPTYSVLITDKDGNAYTQKNLPYGKYIVKETKTPKDYETASDFYFSITQDESEITNVAQKTKHIVVNNEQLEAYIKLIKKDLKTEKTITLNGATFEIKAKEDIYDRATNKILYKKGETISQKIGSKTYTSFTTNSKNIIIPDDSFNNRYDNFGSVVTPLKLPVGKYAIYEIQTPKGFLQLNEPVSFEIKGIRDYDKDQDEDYIKEISIKNEQPTGTLIVDKSIITRENIDKSLIDINDLSGIRFKLTAKEVVKSPIDDSIIYKEGQEVKIFNLDKNGNYTLKDLPMGKYELQELETLNGLVLNQTKYEIEFTQKNLTTKVYEEKKDIANETTVIEFSKKAITGDDELIGAKLSVIDENENIIDTWTSTENTHKIEGLVAGKEYTLKEEIAPNGYVKASSIKFKVEDTNEIQKVEMIDKVVKITKTDLVTGKELEGAELKVLDENGNIIDEWISTNEPHIVNGLEENKKYTLIETIAPYGYELTEQIDFIVTTDKQTQLIEMKDMPILKDIKIIKVDSKTKEIITEKFSFGIYEDNECAKLIKEITSNKEDGFVIFDDLRYGTYFIKEIQSPNGYILSDKIIKLDINDTGVYIDGTLLNDEDSIYSFEFENTQIEVPNTRRY